jgi:DNA-binding MarR family transcriptional regulator
MTKGKRKSEPRPEVERVADRLHSAAIHLLRRVRRVDGATGSGPAQLSALSVLIMGGAMTLGELAAVEQVKPPTMTRIVAGLRRSGWVRLSPDRWDARRMRVCATGSGRRLLEKARKRRIDYLARGLARLEAKDLTLLDRAVTILKDVLTRWQ